MMNPTQETEPMNHAAIQIKSATKPKLRRHLIEIVLTTLILCALALLAMSAGGCAGGTVSRTSVYAGDNFLFQAEKLSVQAHELFLDFYRWEKDFRAVLPVEVSRAADFCRLNEKKWADTANAFHDAYVAVPSAENKNKYQLAISLIRTGLGQAAFYMIDQKTKAPNNGLAPPAVLKAIGVEPVRP